MANQMRKININGIASVVIIIITNVIILIMITIIIIPNIFIINILINSISTESHIIIIYTASLFLSTISLDK